MSFRRQLVRGLALALMATAVRAQTVKVGARAPEIDLSTLSGGHVKLSELRGHAVVFSYWATWCPQCKSEMAELVRAHEARSPAGLRVLCVNGLDQEHLNDQKKSMDKVRRFIEPFAPPFEVALDKRGTVREKYGILGLPSTVFIDSSGVVRLVHRGTISREEMDRGIAAILEVR